MFYEHISYGVSNIAKDDEAAYSSAFHDDGLGILFCNSVPRHDVASILSRIDQRQLHKLRLNTSVRFSRAVLAPKTMVPKLLSRYNSGWPPSEFRLLSFLLEVVVESFDHRISTNLFSTFPSNNLQSFSTFTP
jgi:hypothetical protein